MRLSAVLVEQLRELQADGLVERVETGPAPEPVVYRLTPYGLTVLPVVENIRVWGEAHLRRTFLEPVPDKAIRWATRWRRGPHGR